MKNNLLLVEDLFQRKEHVYRCLIDAAKPLTSAADIDEPVGRIPLSSRCYAPKWQKDSAQGSTLASLSLKRRALKGRKEGLAWRSRNNAMLLAISKSAALTRQSFRNALSELHPRSGLGMLSGRSRFIVVFPGLKPWTESCCPFGTILRRFVGDSEIVVFRERPFKARKKSSRVTLHFVSRDFPHSCWGIVPGCAFSIARSYGKICDQRGL